MFRRNCWVILMRHQNIVMVILLLHAPLLLLQWLCRGVHFKLHTSARELLSAKTFSLDLLLLIMFKIRLLQIKEWYNILFPLKFNAIGGNDEQQANPPIFHTDLKREGYSIVVAMPGGNGRHGVRWSYPRWSRKSRDIYWILL